MTADALRAAVASWVADSGSWSALVRHDPHERTFSLLHRDPELEVYLICWMQGHDTGFHDHGDRSAEIAVVRGSVLEERLALGPPTRAVISAGEFRSVPRSAIHRMRHTKETPAVTLHAYSPPLAMVSVYEPGEDGGLRRQPSPAELRLEAAA